MTGRGSGSPRADAATLPRHLVLVRHGESEANRDRRFSASDEVPLTEAGRRQAQELAHQVAARFRPRQILTSTFRRAGETGAIIAARLGLPLATAAGLHERDLGCLKGEPYQALALLTRQDPAYDPARRWLWRPPGGESLEDVRLRTVAALAALARLHDDRQLLVVTHGAVMLSLWAEAAGGWEGASVPDNCGILELTLTPDAGAPLGARLAHPQGLLATSPAAEPPPASHPEPGDAA